MEKEFKTSSALQTKKLGELLAGELRGGEIICLDGELGAGKTTFTQGLLKGLKIKGPYTSPTFAIMKHYHKKWNIKPGAKKQMLNDACSMIHEIYHIDAYRVDAKDLQALGWRDFAGKENSVTIVEWAERVKKIIPTDALWIKFEWIDDKVRNINFSTKK